MNPLTALVERLDGPFVTPRWGVWNTNIEGRWKRMKSRMLAIACFALASILVLPMNVCAWNLNPSAWTDQTSYSLGDPVQIYVHWEVTDPQNWDHDYCIVDLHIHPTTGETTINPSGDYTDGTPPSRSGVVYVTCVDDDGDAYYEWDSNEGWTGTWVVSVIIEAHDDDQQDEEDKVIWDELDSNTFTLS